MELSTTSHDGAPLALLLVDLAINGRICRDLQTGRLDSAVRAPEELARRVRVLFCMLRRTGEPPAGEEPRRGRGLVPSTNSRRGRRLYFVMGLRFRLELLVLVDGRELRETGPVDTI